MEKFELKNCDLYLSEDTLKQEILEQKNAYYQEEYDRVFDPEIAAERMLKEAISIKEPKFKDYIELYGRLNGLEKIAIFALHGSSDGREWIYFDNGKHKLQRWINSKDGKYSALLLHACNSKSHTPKSKKSILIIPDRVISAENRNLTCYSLIVPKIGEVNGYVIDYELNKLNERLKWQNKK